MKTSVLTATAHPPRGPPLFTAQWTGRQVRPRPGELAPGVREPVQAAGSSAPSHQKLMVQSWSVGTDGGPCHVGVRKTRKQDLIRYNLMYVNIYLPAFAHFIYTQEGSSVQSTN